MKITTLLLWAALTALLTGCSCNPGYFAPAYKPTVIGCAPAFVPTR